MALIFMEYLKQCTHQDHIALVFDSCSMILVREICSGIPFKAIQYYININISYLCQMVLFSQIHQCQFSSRGSGPDLPKTGLVIIKSQRLVSFERLLKPWRTASWTARHFSNGAENEYVQFKDFTIHMIWSDVGSGYMYFKQ